MPITYLPRKLKSKIVNSFYKDSKVKIKWVTLKNGDVKPQINYRQKRFNSPTRLLAYKSNQIYQNVGININKFEEAIIRGKTYHKLLEKFSNKELPPIILNESHKKFIKALKDIFKEYKLKPVVGEMTIWSKKTLTMCIVDSIAVDKDGNLWVLELKTPTIFDTQKKLLSFFQLHIAKNILENTFKEFAGKIKSATLHWNEAQAKLQIIKSSDYNLTQLEKLLTLIINTEKEWDKLLSQIKTKQTTKTLNQLFENERQNNESNSKTRRKTKAKSS